jgi:branched-chain amino acid transport system permease protein
MLPQIVVYTFILGSLYLLVSLGFSLISGVLRVFNLGYGIVFTLAAYLVWMCMRDFGLGLIPSIILMVAFQLGITYAMYRGIILRYFEREEILLTALILVANIVEQAVNYKYPIIAGVSIPTTLAPGTLDILGVAIPKQLIIAAIVGLIFTALFVIFFLKSKFGLITRAISQDPQSSLLMGANVTRFFGYACLLSVIPPIVCTLLIAPVWAIDPFMGSSFLMTAIPISILGSLGNLRGSIISSYIIGFVHSIVSFALNPRFMGLAALVVVIAVLVFKPEGITRSESLW